MSRKLDQAEGERLAGAFLFIVRNETFAVNRAALRIETELEKDWAKSDHAVLWEAAYSVLSHSANLSKVFWPSSTKWKCVERGLMMRMSFDVDETSPLYARKVRNGFEHLDERVHAWLAHTDPPSIIDQWVGREADHEQFKDRHIWRYFVVDTGVVSVGDDAVDLFPLLRENDRLYLRWGEIEGKGPHHE